VGLHAASVEAWMGLLGDGAVGKGGGYGWAEVLLRVGHGEGEHWEGRSGCVGWFGVSATRRTGWSGLGRRWEGWR